MRSFHRPVASGLARIPNGRAFRVVRVNRACAHGPVVTGQVGRTVGFLGQREHHAAVGATPHPAGASSATRHHLAAPESLVEHCQGLAPASTPSPRRADYQLHPLAETDGEQGQATS